MHASLLIGMGAALLAALIGTGWQLASRHGVTNSLGPMELAVLRYCIPAVLLLPVLRSTGLLPKTVPRWRLFLFAACGGLPFGLVVLAGAQRAPAAHMGIVMSGSMPLITALAVWALHGERPGPLRLAGLACIAAGVATLGGFSVDGATWVGDLLFLLAAVLWTVHTLAFRGSGLTPWQGGALANAWSALLLLVLLPFVGAPRLLTAPGADLLFQAVWQGVVAGLLGLVAFMVAIARLGAARAALSAALVPPLTACGGALLLGERLDAHTVWSVLLVTVGIVLAALPRRGSA